jgi:hypothetical protein
MQHELILTARPIGGRRKGTNAACTCQRWDGPFSNDKTPEQARRAKWGQEAHARHVASTTVEGDIEALKAMIAKQQGFLTKDIEGGYTSFIEGRMKRLSELVTQLLVDMKRQASGEVVEQEDSSEEDEPMPAWDPDAWVKEGNRLRAEHERWLDEHPEADGYV